MKPAFEAITVLQNSSFRVRTFEELRFSAPYHFHPEYELTLITTGYGKRYVGTHMQDYAPGDLVLLGAHLPHCWKTEASPKKPSASVVIQFHEDFLGRGFFHTPELEPVLQLLRTSRHGLHFNGDCSDVKKEIITLADEQDPLKKLIRLLEILHTLATTDTYTILDKQNSCPQLSLTEQERINTVMAFIVEHFQNPIRLEDVAAIANMTPPAFCKYFKRLTRKTFVETVNDYRIDFARRQLVHSDKAMAQIGFDSGFDDASNFYKTFRQRMHCSPLQYRQQFLHA